MALDTVDRDGLATVVGELRDGVALVTGDDAAATYVNRAGIAILDRAGLRDVQALLARCEHPPGAEAVEVPIGNRNLELRALDVDTTTGPGRVLLFRDVTDLRRHEERLITFSRTSASLAFAESLTEGLDALARDVRNATDMDSCTFLLMGPGGELRQVGVAGDYPITHDYGERLEACRARGAPLLSVQAVAERRPLVVSGWREQTLRDERFAPLHDVSRRAAWDTIAVIPLVIRGEIVGVFNGFYLADRGPSASEIAFLTAIADQAAVAVDNARLLVELERRATLDERHRLARELHDSVSQALFSLTLQTRALEVMVSEDPPPVEDLREGLAEVRELTRGTLAEMRSLIFQLRPEALHEEGLVASIRRHAAAVAAREGIDVRVEGPSTVPGLSSEEGTELFRVVVEAINNAVKHAAPSTVLAELTQDRDGSLTVLVSDDGTGFDPTQRSPGHLGLTSMEERVSRLGGTLEIDSSPGRPTSVRAHLPRRAGQDQEEVSHGRTWW